MALKFSFEPGHNPMNVLQACSSLGSQIQTAHDCQLKYFALKEMSSGIAHFGREHHSIVQMLLLLLLGTRWYDTFEDMK